MYKEYTEEGLASNPNLNPNLNPDSLIFYDVLVQVLQLDVLHSEWAA
jgi:hypothetical protein